MRPLFTTLLLFVGWATPAFSALQPASVFTDNMVLQRDTKLPVWGTADPGARVEVRFGAARASAIVDAAGRWTVVLGPLTANAAPQSLVVTSGDSATTFSNVLVGDVWLCSGQSNMQMTLGDSAGGQEFATRHGQNPLLRLLVVPKQFTDQPRSEQQGKWTTATPETARQFSAVGFSFGAALAGSSALGDVPIGLIDSSFGGTTVEAWIPAGDLQSFDPSHLGDSMFGKPTEHYNAMIAPLAPMAIRGVVWYQGESNADRPAIYARLLHTMIDSWRREFGNPALPFVLVQLPAYNAPVTQHFYTWVREQQALVAEEAKGVSLVVTYDTHDGSDLHPPEKIPIGARAAAAARALAYGEQLIATGPRYKSHSINGAEVRLTFDTHGEQLVTRDGSSAVRGFQLAGDNGEYHFATGKLAGDNAIAISAAGISKPKTVRFAWAGAPDANLASASGLPVEPFRTDKLPPDDVAFMRVPIPRAVKTPAYELTIDANGSLRSLGVGGEQFIANDLGLHGGSCIPTFFGPRKLIQVEEIGPKQLVFRDAEVSLTYKFAADSITLTVDNHSTDELQFQIALAPGIAAGSGDATKLQKGRATLKIVGFDQTETPANAAKLLKTRVPAGQSRTIQIKATQ